jgi:hypothetical protein
MKRRNKVGGSVSWPSFEFGTLEYKSEALPLYPTCAVPSIKTYKNVSVLQ